MMYSLSVQKYRIESGFPGVSTEMALNTVPIHHMWQICFDSRLPV